MDLALQQYNDVGVEVVYEGGEEEGGGEEQPGEQAAGACDDGRGEEWARLGGALGLPLGGGGAWWWPKQGHSLWRALAAARKRAWLLPTDL